MGIAEYFLWVMMITGDGVSKDVEIRNQGPYLTVAECAKAADDVTSILEQMLIMANEDKYAVIAGCSKEKPPSMRRRV